jgi:tRNA threonylcarbamoyladenosine biosynthesis protein TsaE
MEMIINGLEDLPRAAGELVPRFGGRGVVALYGGMGAGKTTLVAALLREMGSADEVSSPTFALVNDYLTREGRHVYHFDFYRIDSPAEAFDLGYEEYFYSGELCLVEWPEKIEELLPDDTLHLHIDTLPDGSRRINLQEE